VKLVNKPHAGENFDSSQRTGQGSSTPSRCRAIPSTPILIQPHFGRAGSLPRPGKQEFTAGLDTQIWSSPTTSVSRSTDHRQRRSRLGDHGWHRVPDFGASRQETRLQLTRTRHFLHRDALWGGGVDGPRRHPQLGESTSRGSRARARTACPTTDRTRPSSPVRQSGHT
jgi:hypothetical protein